MNLHNKSYEELLDKINFLENELGKCQFEKKEILENLPYASWIKDTEGKFTMVNEKFAKEKNLIEAQIIGRKGKEIDKSEDAALNEEDDNKILEEQNPSTFELFNNGRWYEIFKTPIYNEKGELSGIFGISKDITHRKEILHKLNKEREFLQALMDNIPDSIYFKDTKSRFTRINKSKAMAIGLEKPEDAIGKTDFDYFKKKHAKLAFQDEENILRTGVPLLDKVEKLTDRDGKAYWMSATKIALRDEQGNITGLVGISRDITDRIQANKKIEEAKKKAEESDKLKTAFLANMSHEIRTPMNGIIGFANLLKKDELDEVEREEYINHINSCSNTLLTLIDDIIDISKIEAGQINFKLSEVSIHNICEDLLETFTSIKDKEGKANISLRLNIPEGLENISLITDPNRFKQVFTNLVGNALKFTNNGYIEFGYKQESAGWIIFYVKDTGIGIPEDKFEFIFNRFAQLNDSNNMDQNKGTGLGLAISSSLVHLLGGDIWVESSPGEGSTFFFKLPYDRGIVSRKPDVHVAYTNGQDYTWKNKRVLIAEDEEINVSYFTELLKRTGIDIQYAKTGYEAIHHLTSKSDIDLILMDLKMPELDGLMATQIIRGFNKNIPIIAQTAYAMQDEKDKCIQIGFNDYISKPIIKEVLLKLMNKYLA